MIHSEINLRQEARTTGWIYFFFALMGIFSFAFAEPALFVANNATATAERMLANENLFRTDKAFAMLSGVLFIIIVWRLYQLFRPVDLRLSLLMVLLVAVTIPAALAGTALHLTAFQMFKGHLASTQELEIVREQAMVLLKLANNISQMLTLYWGLWLVPLGLLVYKSGFMPRWLGLLILINGAGYVVHCFAFLLFPAQFKTILGFVFPTYFAGEIPFIFWLTIRGINPTIRPE
jgi:hypothetical protein